MTKKISGRQKMFNKVVRHVRKQGVAAVDSKGDCKYRIMGLECAAGCLMPNKLYKKSFECTNIDSLLTQNKGKKLWAHFNRLYGLDGITTDLLSELQYVHDSWLVRSGLEGFNTQITVLAEKYGLTVPK